MVEIREYRLKLGLTQKEIGKRLNVSKSAVSQYESGARKPDIITLKKLSVILNCSTDDLLKSINI